MVSFCLTPNFVTSSKFNTPLEGIRILRVPLGTSLFTSSFIKDAFLKDVQHINVFPRMGDVQIAYEILTYGFVQWQSYLL
jgi:hypothetical protein